MKAHCSSTRKRARQQFPNDQRADMTANATYGLREMMMMNEHTCKGGGHEKLVVSTRGGNYGYTENSLH